MLRSCARGLEWPQAVNPFHHARQALGAVAWVRGEEIQDRELGEAEPLGEQGADLGLRHGEGRSGPLGLVIVQADEESADCLW